MYRPEAYGQTFRSAFLDVYNEVYKQACKEFPEIINFYGYSGPQVRFNLKGRSAGQFRCNHYHQDYVIRFNPQLANHQDHWRQTCVHEIAHAVQRAMDAIDETWSKPHGTIWRQVVIHLGGDPRRTHTLGLKKSRRVRQYRYKCKCRDDHWIGATKHKRHQQGRRHYYCLKCKHSLTYTGHSQLR